MKRDIAVYIDDILESIKKNRRIQERIKKI